MNDEVATRIELPGEVVANGVNLLAGGPQSDEGRDTFERQMAAVEAAESISIQDLARIRIR